MNSILLFYYSLPHDDAFGVVSKVFNRLMAMLLKRVLDITVPQYFKKTQGRFFLGVNKSPRDKKIIVSLTSFPSRIDDLWIVIECLFRQSYQADRIILWLSESEFAGYSLPKSLLDQQERGLEIKFVDGNLRSHNKYIYSLEAFPNDYVITVDDDVYYDVDLIKNLIALKAHFPDAVVVNRAHKITFDKEGKIASYRYWKHNCIGTSPSYLLVMTGVLGALYERSDVVDSYNDRELIEKYIPYADDLWIKVQTLLTGRKVATNSCYNKDPLTVRKSQLEKLVTKNVLRGGNDKQFKEILNLYNLGNLEKFKEK